MPIHDFQCGKCGHRFEELVKAGQKPQCPACGAKSAEKLFSGAAVSTTKTRAHAMKGARGKAQAQKREKDHAHSQYLSNHIKDHS